MQQLLTLSNGVRVRLIHDPSASRAAALVQLAAGSHHEPPQWPGLAHLLEHVVFTGSAHYQGDDRLMSWAQAQGARLNATTLPTTTAWFFDLRAAQLGQGLARLTDMLAQPLFAREAIEQEVAVIDAEYQLLSTHADTLRDAALSLAFDAPAALQHFHVGDAVHFGTDFTALQQALRDYHQRYFHAANLTLWLQGPQSLSELAALAERYATQFRPASTVAALPAALALQPARHFALQLADTPRLRFSFPLADAPSLTLLRQLVTDKAAGSLLAVLGERGYADDAQLLVPYRSENGSVVSIEFQLTAADTSLCAAVESLFCHWLRQLTILTEPQREHYAALAQQQFHRLSPVDQLRERAFGFSPVAQCDEANWQRLLAQLTASNMTRLRVAPQLDAEQQRVQGFPLSLTVTQWSATMAKSSLPQWHFYPWATGRALPALPQQQCYLPHIDPDQHNGVLMLSPAVGSTLPARWGHIIQSSLRAIIAQCAHAGGSLSFSPRQGQWLLQLTGNHQVLLHTLDALLTQLQTIPASLRAQGERNFARQQQQWRSDIAVRCLLNQLPQLIGGEAGRQSAESSLPRLPWCATLYGGDKALQQAVSRLLTRFPGDINAELPPAAAPLPQQPAYCLPTDSQDAAVVLFCPLVEQTAACLAAWRILALLFEPRIFQQLRVEKNLGYVVSCRFMSVAGEHGLLFAVQSPTHNLASITAHIQHFISQMPQVIATLEAPDFAEKCALLTESLHSSHQDRLEQCGERWLDQQSFAPALTQQAISRLTMDNLLNYCQRLVKEQARWWMLNNHPR
ncbi:pyrroloquinoline quinone biosynthesis protein PqqF [Winslowiella iniecta]|uniref:Pyrroloquinoline quinone biosynthesis protein F n=1 Tax=Winslowiella iniecta TaxID=1560201 RepID=A0A0L7SYW0_9GAMM|nr:pyrroloquinoline quinone biosynthesis protein PqqF [Winslowiella iniecta]KOC88166.1 pyrroloquinoline quinone biosynthesis protein F [Winslowiella iniecta]KOC94190.1 pyrroloquinoline quinone biosynthesis protein F [Winslowiella iniecta]